MRTEIHYHEIESIFDKFADQNWNTDSKFQLFVQWMGKQFSYDHDELMRSLEDYLSNVSEEEAVSFQDNNEPTVTFSADQINKGGAWLKFCDWHGMNEYAMAEGQCDSWETFKIPLSKAKEWRLI